MFAPDGPFIVNGQTTCYIEVLYSKWVDSFRLLYY